MLCSLILASSIAAPPPPAGAAALPRPRYYFILFGGQATPYLPRTAHTWATYVRVTPVGGQALIEPLTISWMPTDEAPRAYNLLPGRGKNCSLAETFAIMERNKARVSYWGPYEIDADRFNLAAAQVAHLRSGEIRYRMIDSVFLDKTVCHCAHAVTYADPNLKWLIQPVLRPGEPGTSMLAYWYKQTGAFVEPDVTHDWLVPVLGLDQTAAVKRQPGEWIFRPWQ